MNFSKTLSIFCFTLVFGLMSCNSEYTTKNLLEDIEEENYDSILSRFAEPKLLDIESAKVIISQYAQFLKAESLTQKDYEDEFSFNRDKRTGVLLLDDNKNIFSSITCKIVKVQEEDKIVFIDFRISDNPDVPHGNLIVNGSYIKSLKVPMNIPLRNVDIPNYLPLDKDSLRSVYPIELHGEKFYHTEMLHQRFLEPNGDSLKTVLAFNVGNLNIKNNLKDILNDLKEKYDLSVFTLALRESYGEPVTRIVVDRNYINGEFLDTFTSIIKNRTGSAHVIYKDSNGLPRGLQKSSNGLHVGGIVGNKRNLRSIF